MANRHNKKGRSKREGQYVPLPYSMLKHPAWRALSPAATKTWLELRCRYNGSNNGKLSLSLEDGAKHLHLSKTTVARALKELEAAGFIVKTKQGHWHGRQATEWRVTDESCDGNFATRDWQKLAVVPNKNKTRYRDGTYLDRHDAA